MAQLAVGALNTLNEKGLRYKAEVSEAGQMAFKFAMLLGGKKAVVQITPLDDKIAVTGLGNDKGLDLPGFETFVDKVLETKAIQEKLSGLEDELKA